MAVTIPPKTASFEVVITGKPLEGNGILEIKGIYIRCFNLLCEHPISDDGSGLSLYIIVGTKPNCFSAKNTFIIHNNREQRSHKNVRSCLHDNHNVAPVNKINVVSALPLLFIQETSTNGSKLKLFEGQR